MSRSKERRRGMGEFNLHNYTPQNLNSTKSKSDLALLGFGVKKGVKWGALVMEEGEGGGVEGAFLEHS